jgi:hypothetical protein
VSDEECKEVTVKPIPVEEMVSARVVAITWSPDGNFTVSQAGIETLALPSLLRVVANYIERQLGI